MNPRFRPSVLLLLSLLVTSCGSGATAPAPPVDATLLGRFDLVEYDGSSLPASTGVTLSGVSGIVGDTRTYSCPVMLSAATIDVASNGGANRTLYISYPCAGTLPHPNILDETKVEPGTLKATGDSITFTYVASNGVTAYDFARISGTDLVFFLHRQGIGVTETVGSTHRVYRKK